MRTLFIFAAILAGCYEGVFVTASPEDDVIYVNGGMACGDFTPCQRPEFAHQPSSSIFRSGICTIKVTGTGASYSTACTVLVGLVEQVAEVHNRTVTDMVSELCTFLPGEYSMLCDILVHLWGPAIIEKLSKRETPDVICYSLGICHVDPGLDYCHLFPEPKEGMAYAVEQSRRGSKVLPFFHWTLVESLHSACLLPGVSQVCKNVRSALNNMKPFLDIDKDKYSIIKTFRGDSWRGKDCDDVNELIYPGRLPMEHDIFMDSNCNGISGVNASTGEPYERAFCHETEPRGLIYIGDSIGAHFHVPPQWFTATELSVEILKNLSFVLGNELDWPHASFPTGYQNVTWPIVNGYTDSVYLRLRERNLCNHRDFQNICFNGAASDTMLDYLKSIARDSFTDKPALVFYAMMGNDVCNRYMSSLDDLRTPEEFRSNVIQTLDILNNLLPNGSHVLLVGLVDGSFIYNTMKDRYHPVGQLHKDVTYADVFEWFNCMRIGPCYGWMNSNETVRQATTERAEELTAVLKDIAANVTYQSFDLHYLHNPLRKVVKQWVEDGKELWQFLEPVDSLHPVQEALPLIVQAIWDEILENFPEVLGQVNPHNHLIKSIFGDQGGH